jgi:hypothetical protein
MYVNELKKKSILFTVTKEGSENNEAKRKSTAVIKEDIETMRRQAKEIDLPLNEETP